MPLSNSRRTVMIMLSLILVGAIGLVAFTALQPLPPSTLPKPLAEILPQTMEGWTVKDEPIAETAEMKQAVGELLNYDDAVFRTYSQGDISIAVYVAYWKPGKMSPRLIAGHTPDVCWIGAGWKCTARDFAYRVKTPRHDFPLAQAGTYEMPGNVQHVLFWHVHGDEVVSYDIQGTPPWWAALSDMWRKGLNQRDEQFFVRISSNQPLSQAVQSAAMRDILESLEPVKIAQPAGLETTK